MSMDPVSDKAMMGVVTRSDPLRLPRGLDYHLPLAWLLYFLQFGLALFLGFMAIMSAMSTAHCDQACDYPTLGLAFRAQQIVWVGLLIASPALIVIFRRSRGVGVVPLAAMAVTAVSWWVYAQVAYKAMLF